MPPGNHVPSTSFRYANLTSSYLLARSGSRQPASALKTCGIVLLRSVNARMTLAITSSPSRRHTGLPLPQRLLYLRITSEFTASRPKSGNECLDGTPSIASTSLGTTSRVTHFENGMKTGPLMLTALAGFGSTFQNLHRCVIRWGRNALLTCSNTFTRLPWQTCLNSNLIVTSGTSAVLMTKITWGGSETVGTPWHRTLFARTRITTFSTSCCEKIMATNLSPTHITASIPSSTTRPASAIL